MIVIVWLLAIIGWLAIGTAVVETAIIVFGSEPDTSTKLISAIFWPILLILTLLSAVWRE